MKDLAIPRLKKPIGKSLNFMARDIQLSVAAAQLAFSTPGCRRRGRPDPDRRQPRRRPDLDRAGRAGPGDRRRLPVQRHFDYDAYAREGIGKITPIWLLKYLPNMLACHISILLDCQGPSNTITEAEAASNVAIGEATRIIARGRADVMITGGADSKIHPLSMVRMSLLDQMSRWRGEPSGACRPFDAARDGWVPGEGAGILILEEREHALARGAPGSTARSSASARAATPAPSGASTPTGGHRDRHPRRAPRRQAPADRLGHVNAHGAATVVSDLAEARAIGRVFGEGPGGVPVTALKGYMGNIVSGCGAVELIASLLGVNRGLIPATLNCDEPDPACGRSTSYRRAPAHRTRLPEHQPDPPRPGRGRDRPGESRPDLIARTLIRA